MSETATSLESAQPLLFSLPETELRAELKRFTGEGLRQRDAERYQLIVDALGLGVSEAQIARTLGVSANTVAAIRQAEGLVVGDIRVQTAAKMRRGAAAAAEFVLEGMARMDPSDPQAVRSAAIAAGVLTDKAQLLEGEPTLRVEEVKRIDAGQWNDLIARLPVGTGLGGERELGNLAPVGAVLEVEMVAEKAG